MNDHYLVENLIVKGALCIRCACGFEAGGKDYELVSTLLVRHWDTVFEETL